MLRSFEQTGTHMGYKIHEATASGLKRSVEESIRYYSYDETTWADDAAKGSKVHQIAAYRQAEFAKLAQVRTDYEGDPKFFFSLQPFVFPISEAKAAEIEKEYFLAQAYSCMGHRALSAAGMSFFQKIGYICRKVCGA